MICDCIIIGGGHNGLVAAAYLAKAGKKVCVLERRDVLGGCASTEELWDGFHISPAAYVVSLLPPSIINDLGLKDRGFEVLPRNPASITLLPDGRSLILGHDKEKNFNEIRAFSEKDAQNYEKYEQFLERVAKVLEPWLESTPPNFPIKRKHRKLFRNIAKAARFGMDFLKLGEDIPDTIELLMGASTKLLDKWFESDELKATLATDAVIGAFLSPSTPGSAYVLLHHVMGEAGGARGVWGYVKGGMGSLSKALKKVCEENGVIIRTNTEVKEILRMPPFFENKAPYVRGVMLTTGELVKAPVVASSIDANWTFNKLLKSSEGAPDNWDQFHKRVSNIDYSSATAKINLALDGLPNFNFSSSTINGYSRASMEECLRGTIHISPGVQYIERAFGDAYFDGKWSQKPIMEITIPTTVDDTISPPGKHIASIFIQYAPYKLSQGNWDDRREEFGDHCLTVLEEYFPDIKKKILHRQILTPVDLERKYRLTGGNIFQGAMSPNQLFSLRPAFGWADHRTPYRGLYLCGAASHPGGGVMGVCGRNAANVILKDNVK